MGKCEQGKVTHQTRQSMKDSSRCVGDVTQLQKPSSVPVYLALVYAVCLSVCLSVCLFVCLSIFLSACLPVDHAGGFVPAH